MSNLDLSDHTLNNSTTKQKYSFPKSKRFQQRDKRPLCESFYDIPTTIARRTTMLGYGNKDMGITNKPYVPGVGNYNLDSEINPEKHKRNSITFGVGREHMQLGGPLGHLKVTQKLPAPCAYNIKDTKDPRATAIRSRLPDHEFEKSTKNPGPGTYNHQNMGNNNYYITSKFPNATNRRISQVSRLDPISTRRASVGPAEYDVVDSMNNVGRYSLAKHSSVSSCVFAKSQRQGVVERGTIYNPGPGQYNSFSNFG